MSAFSEGYEAYYSHWDINKNPYHKDEDNHLQWNEGFWSGMDEELGEFLESKESKKLDS